MARTTPHRACAPSLLFHTLLSLLSLLAIGGLPFTRLHPSSQPHLQKVNLDRLDYCSCLENLNEIKFYKNYKLVKGNICSSYLVKHVLEEEKIDTIMHFAAQTHVDNSFVNSFSFIQNNILGTHVLLESAKLHGIKRFIHVSTDEVYGEGEANQEPMFEDQVLEVQSEGRRKR
jgi:UDP-glucose 4,6-dehydratase